MLLTRHFVFLHIPKTGGNFVRNAILPHVPEDWHLRQLEPHATFADIPASHDALPRVAFVRNPYAWYVSWFHFQQRTRDEFFLEISDGGRLGFHDTMRAIFYGATSFYRGDGPMLQTLWEMLGRDLSQTRFGKMETMREDLEQRLGEIVDLPDAMVNAIRSLPPQNTSRHGHYSRYYDEELRDLVFEKDRAVFEYFGYGFENADS